MKKDTTQKIKQYEINTHNISDHDQIYLEITWGKRPRWGQGTWKLNNNLLNDETFRQEVNSTIQIYKANKQFFDPNTGWDHFKLKIQTIAKERATDMNKQKKHDIEILQKSIRYIKDKIDKNIDKTTNTETLKLLEKELTQKTQEQRIKAKQDKILFDERPTKYFYDKNKTKPQTKQITLLKTDNDKNLETKDDILTETHKFYSRLYNTKPFNQEQTDKNLKYITDKLDKIHTDKLNEPFTEKEIRNVILNMKKDKSPGEDGITAEFYKTFLDDLTPELSEIFNNLKLSHNTPASWKNAIIKLLFKKNDVRKLENWRPISLTNVDYKILSKVLTNRLNNFMDLIIPLEQKCGVKNRRSTDIIRNLATFRDNMDEGYFVTIDQSKAFDKVNHDYLLKVLEHIGIKGDFLQISKMFLNNMTSQVEINGGLSDKIYIKRGIRQGCPFSMLHFIISTIPLIQMIKANKTISGHTTKKNNVIKIQAYADDITIVVKRINEINNILTTFNNHSKASEAEINKDKTEILKIGNKIEKNNDYHEKIKPKVKILGAYFCENKKDETKYNLEKASKTLTDLKANNYNSLMGKILNINTYVYSKIWNNAFLINTKDKHYKDFIKQIENYLNYTKGNEIRENVEKKISEKGLGLINITERLKTIQIKEFLEAATKKTETDNILYTVGTHDNLIYDQTFLGPKAENNTEREKEIIKLLIDKKEDIKNFKTRHKITTTKNIQDILYPKEKRHYFKEIFKAQEPKLISLNYKIVHNLLPFKDNSCYFCNSNTENIKHIFLQCNYLKKVRERVEQYLQEYNIELNRETIIDMYGIDMDLPAQVISQYKYTVWAFRNEAKRTTDKKKIPKGISIVRTIEKEIDFYKQYTSQYAGYIS